MKYCNFNYKVYVLFIFINYFKSFTQNYRIKFLFMFICDIDLASDYWCPLSLPKMLMVVLDIVQKHIPNLEALNLDSNKLLNIEKLNVLAEKFKNLKILHIGDNKVKQKTIVNYTF